jgi:DNA-binding XRE family transcriptional regulator
MDKSKIAEKLVALRGDRSREAVAAAVGISVSALAMYETGARTPKDEIKIALANYYETPIAEIFFS